MLFISSICFSQNTGRITYKSTIAKTSVDESASDFKKKLVDFLNDMKKIKDSIPLNLDFKGKEFVFYPDKQTNIGLSDKRGYKSAIKSFNNYYRNDNTQIALEEINSEDKSYLVSSKTIDVNWIMTNETKIIGEYNCIKATTTVWTHKLTKGKYEKTIEAWFTPSIPVKLGPLNYGDLPGLILELKDEIFTYYVTDINLNPNFKIEIKKLEKGNLIDKKEFLNSRKTITREKLKEYIGG